MKKIIILFISCITIVLTICILISRRTNTNKDDKVINVKTCYPQFENVYSDIESYGTVFYKTKTEVTCLVSGNVIKKNFNEGDYIKKGEALYILKNIELEIEHTQNQNKVNSALANIQLYQAKLDEKINEVKSRLISVKNLESEIEIAKNNLNLANEKLIKNIELNKLGGITDQEIIEMTNQIETLNTQLEIKQRELSMTNLGLSKEDLIQNNIIPSDDKRIFEQQLIDLNTKSSKADLEVAETEYKNANANLLLTEKLLDDLIIKSPVNGIIGAANYENGEYIRQNEKVAAIIDISTCIAQINIQESNIYDISIGNHAKIEIPAAQKTIDTFISDISPIADTETGNFYVKANFINTDNMIKPGMYLKCSISNNNNIQYLKIPETALFNATEKTADCFIIKDGIAFIQKIQIAFIKNGFAFITTGLSENSQIINCPAKTIKDGTYVKIL